ncbi:phage portal protein [Epibacterium sp. SM1979]|uniref:Phage portal protein n=1 Tax=Tritonibacter litoralis TaxID=2662264 RepID=A0A843YBA5_9RHOB|nr:phage portal protein [Tritonibacter litoralis]MQQ06945.1 phage portal protein [Tritonibacter litoralis]
MLFDRLRRPNTVAPDPAPETKASAAARLVNMAAGTQAAWSPRDTGSLTRSGFVANPVGFRAVKLIAEAAAALPVTLQDVARRYDTHPMLALINRPNAAQGRAAFLEALYGHLLLSGNAFIEAAGGEGLPAELHVLRSDRMRVVPGADGWPQAYEYAVGGRKHRFAHSAISPICHIRSFHPQDDHYGLSPLQAAAMSVDVHNAASRWSKSLLDNAARPSGALVWRGTDALGTLSEEQFRRLSDEIADSFQGARNAGRPMVLEGGLDWKPMGFSPSDMEFQQTKDAAAREIALAFGVPPMLMGIKGDATYANYQEANRAFYRLTVLPLAARVMAELSDWLSAHLGQPLTLAPDLDQVPALAAEREAQWRRIAGADFLTDAEKRHMLGLPAKMQEQADG